MNGENFGHRECEVYGRAFPDFAVFVNSMAKLGPS